MNKRPISVTLQPDNLTWLRGRAEAIGCRSISELLDRLVTDARTGGRPATARSVVGTIRIAESDPALEGADDRVREAFEVSVRRGTSGEEPKSRRSGRSRRG